MKRFISAVLVAVIMTSMVIGTMAIAPSDAAVYSTGSITLQGSPYINGDVIMTGGTATGARSGNCIDGTLYKTANVKMGFDNFDSVRNYDGNIEDYEFEGYNAAPADFEFADCEFSDGTGDLVVDYWVDRAEERANGYSLGENAFINKLEVKPNLTLDINTNDGEVRVLRVKSLVISGQLTISGSGSVVIYVDGMGEGRNGMINADYSSYGDKDALTLVYNKDVSLHVFKRISANIVALGDITLENIYQKGNVYAAGDVTFSHNGNINGLIYAPNSHTEMTGSTVLDGRLVTNELSMTGATEINSGYVSEMRNEVKSFLLKSPAAPVEPKPVEPTPAVPDAGEGANRVNVVRYTPESGEYVCGTMLTKNHTPRGLDVVYEVLDETTFTPNENVVPETAKEKLELLAVTTNSVFEFRKNEISLYPFGRIDEQAYRYSLTISPFVVPLLAQAGFTTATDTEWLVWGDTNGSVVTVWLQLD